MKTAVYSPLRFALLLCSLIALRSLAIGSVQLPPQLTWTISDHNGQMISCSGANDGTIDLTISGGVSPYQVQWSGPGGFNSTTEDISLLAAGIYDVIVTDDNNESSSATIQLTSPDPLNIVVSKSNKNGYGIGCHGGSDGNLDVTIAGGTSPYQYQWIDPAGGTYSSEDMLGVQAGNYSLTVTDANGCNVSGNYTLTEPDELISNNVLSQHIGGFNVSCSDASNGKIDQTPMGGVSPHTFDWSGPNGFTSTSAQLSGMVAGAYTLTLTDANGCVAYDTVQLTAPDPLVAILNGPALKNGYHLACAGEDDAFIDALITGGTPFFSFNWTGPNSSTFTSEDLNNLAVGTYNLMVTDTNGCVANSSLQLTEPDPITITSIISDYNGYEVSCDGADGSVDINASGGVAGYTYYWINSNANTYTSQDLNGVGPSSYSLNLTDANSCTMTEDFILEQAPSIHVSLALSDLNGFAISCNNANDGSIDATITNATVPATITWAGPNGFSSSMEDLDSLSAGQYNLSITDGIGCSYNDSVILIEPAAFTTQLTTPDSLGFNVLCNSSATGQIVADISGGETPLNTSWIGPNGFSSNSTSLNGLEAGTYTISSMDANGCVSDQSITLTQPIAPPSVNFATSSYLSGHEVSCANSSDGWVDASTSGGTAPYTFLWTLSNGMTDASEDLAGLPAGNHLLSITDALGCSISDTIQLTAPDPIALTSMNSSQFGTFNLTCSDSDDGSLAPQLTGGFGLYAFSWSGPNGYASIDNPINDLEAGAYSLMITDENGCTYTDSITLTAPSAISSGISALTFPGGTQISCSGADDASVNAIPTGGMGWYTFLWNGPTGFTSTSASISNLAPGNYCVEVNDANNCQATDCVIIIEPAEIDLASTITDADCGQAVGAIDLNIVGGTAPFSYNWGNGENTEDIQNLSSGMYAVSVSDANGCTALLNNTVLGSDAPEIFVNINNVSCAAGSDGSIDISVINGSAPYSYNWSNGAQSQDISGLPANTYTIDVTDSKGCTSTQVIDVNEPDPLIIELDLTDFPGGFQVSAFNAADGAATALVSGGTSPYSIDWSTGYSGSTINGLTAGDYAVSVIDAHGCEATESFTMEHPFELEMPTGFSPNNDGYNDSFIIQGIELYPNNQLNILNRWGDVVYSRNGYQNNWQGEGRNGKALVDGTYFVVFTAANEGIELTGYVELRR